MKKQRLEDRRTLTNGQQQEKERQYAQLEHKIQQAEQMNEEGTQILHSFLGRYHLQGMYLELYCQSCLCVFAVYKS